MFYHVILTTGCNGRRVYCYKNSLEDMEEAHDFEHIKHNGCEIIP